VKLKRQNRKKHPPTAAPLLDSKERTARTENQDRGVREEERKEARD
jgi:hypothetical protein